MRVEDVINNQDAMNAALSGFALRDQELLSGILTAPGSNLSQHRTFGGSSTAFATSLRAPLRSGPDNDLTPAG